MIKNENKLSRIEKIALTKQKTKEIQNIFYQTEWNDQLQKWGKLNESFSITMQLAFWTMWSSRWAKEYHIRHLKAKTKKEYYINKKSEIYDLKNTSLQLLIQSPFTELSFFKPQNANKSKLTYCEIHNNDWKDNHSNLNKWNYYKIKKEEVKQCSNCTYEFEENFYSLYSIIVSHPDLENCSFSFHTPYVFGKDFLPDPTTLKQVEHQPQDGVFRFGRTLKDQEKDIFKRDFVFKNYQNALLNFKEHFSIEN